MEDVGHAHNLTKVVEPDLDVSAQGVVLDCFLEKFGGLGARGVSEGIPGGGGFVVRGALTAEECSYLRTRMGYNESLRHMDNTGAVYRETLRLQISHENVAAALLSTVRPLLPETFTINEGDTQFGPASSGTWTVSHANPSLRFCKYDAGGQFKPHYDGIYLPGIETRSLWTLMFYLNSDFEGGETRFLKESGEVLAVLKPDTPGMCVCFPVDRYHEGCAVTSGEKYIVRTDVMFTRVCAGPKSRVPNERRRQAEELLALAREFEYSKQCDKAVDCYRRAFKLDPDLERLAS